MVVDSKVTKDKILNAAIPIFANRGFDDATVREICESAGVNQAAINYHFGDKQSLYAEAVKHCCARGRPQEFPAGFSERPAAEQLREFIRQRVSGILASRDDLHHRKLLLREMGSPTAATQDLMRNYVRSQYDILLGIVKAIVPDGVSQATLYMILFSITGQFMFYRAAAPMGAMIMGEEDFAGLTVEDVVDHIYQFSLAALGAVRPDWRSPSRPPHPETQS